MNESLKGRMAESTDLNQSRWRLIGSKKPDRMMTVLES